MNEIHTIILLTVAAGVCIPIGGVIASFEHIHPIGSRKNSGIL